MNYFTFFRPILLTTSLSRNAILTHFPLFGFLDSLLCVLVAPIPGLAFSQVMLCMLAESLSFSSGRAYLPLNFLPPLFLRLIPTLIMQGSSTSLLTTPLRSHFLMCTTPYLLFSGRWQNRFLFYLHFLLLQKSLHFGRLQLPSHPLGLKSYFREYSTGSSLLSSSPSMTLTHPLFYIAPLAIASHLTFPLLPPLLPFPAHGRCSGPGF